MPRKVGDHFGRRADNHQADETNGDRVANRAVVSMGEADLGGGAFACQPWQQAVLVGWQQHEHRQRDKEPQVSVLSLMQYSRSMSKCGHENELMRTPCRKGSRTNPNSNASGQRRL